MADVWYYSFDHLRLGPFSGRELKDLADLGRIQPSDTVWKEGVELGVLASKVKYLFSPFPAVVAVTIPGVVLAGVAALGEQASPAPAGPATPVRDTKLMVAAVVVEETTPPAAPAPAAPPPADKVKHGRAVAVKGAVIVSQDGARVKFLKKCTTCGHLDSSWNTMPIRNGVIRVFYFCSKCKKNRDVELRCSVY